MRRVEIIETPNDRAPTLDFEVKAGDIIFWFPTPRLGDIFIWNRTTKLWNRWVPGTAIKDHLG